MLKKLELKNFQSHKHSVLEFHPNVNVIVGESDSGKSAILRAIYWVVFGKPSGESMRRWEVAADTSVTIEVDDNIVTRVRGDKNNLYRVNEQEYKGFGQNVPPQVANVLNMESINFSRQMDMPFLFSMSPGELAQYLNKLVDLEIIGETLSNISRKVKQHQKQVSVYEASIDTHKSQLSELEWVDEAQKKITQLNKLEKQLSKKQRQHSEVVSILDKWDSVVSKLKKYKYISNAEKELNTLTAQYNNLQSKLNTAKQTTNALSRYNNAKKALTHAKPIINAEKAIVQLQNIFDKYTFQIQQYKKVENAVNKITDISNKYKNLACNLKQLQVQYKQQMPDICPLCGNKTGKEK